MIKQSEEIIRIILKSIDHLKLNNFPSSIRNLFTLKNKELLTN